MPRDLVDRELGNGNPTPPASAPIKAIGGTRSDARTRAILVRQDSPIKTAADLKGKRLAGTRGCWGQFLVDATLEKAGYKVDDAAFAPLGPVDAKKKRSFKPSQFLTRAV